jgi:two-component system sensor kinase FixL
MLVNPADLSVAGDDPVMRNRSSTAEHALTRARATEERFEAVLDASPDAILITDDQGLIETFNASAERLFGYREEDLRGHSIARLLPGAGDQERAAGFLDALAGTPAGSPVEAVAIDAGDTEFPVEISVGHAGQSGGRAYIAVIRDIRERRTAATALARSESNLRMAQALAHLGSFEFSFPGDGTMYWSDEVFRILGLEPTHGVPPLSILRDEILHPEDRRRVVAEVLEAARHGGDVDLDYRVCRRDGSAFHVQTSARVEVLEAGASWRISGTIMDVTERHRIEQAMRFARDRAEFYLDLVGVMIVAVDVHGDVTLINRRGLRTLGATEDEVLGRNFFELFTPTEFRKTVVERFGTLVRSKGDPDLRIDEGWVETMTGQRRLIQWRNKKMLDADGRVTGVLGAGEDITEQRHVEEQLRRAEEELRLTFQHAPIGMATLDADGNILNVNQSYCNMLGYQPDDLLGRPKEELTHPEDRAATRTLLGKLLGGEIEYVRHEKRYIRRDGSVMRGVVRYSVIRDPRGRPLMIVAQIVDRTEQIQAEMEIRQHRERLAQLARLGTMGEMAAGIAHELNQPLTAVANYAQACQHLIDSGAIELDELKGVLGKITDQARRAGKVIEGLRRFVKRRAIVKRATDMQRVVGDVMMLAELDCRAHGIPIASESEDPLPQVQGDPIQLQQVLLNLVRNAVDSMAGRADRDRGIRVTAAAEGRDEVSICVIDHGSGIAREDAGRLFDPFFTTKQDGMGMGLALSRSIVEAHGGRLSFTDNPAGGTMFRMTLPTMPEGKE